jgi:hypothetical protein
MCKWHVHAHMCNMCMCMWMCIFDIACEACAMSCVSGSTVARVGFYKVLTAATHRLISQADEAPHP